MKGFSDNSKKYGYKKWTIGSVIGLLLLWTAIAALYDNVLVIPSPLQVVANIGRWLMEPKFYLIVGTSFLRAVICFLVALLVAVPSGIWAGLNPRVQGVLSPLVSLGKSVPTLAIIILVLIWFSSSMTPLVVSFIVIWPLLYDNVLAGMAGTDQNLLEMAKVFKLPLSKHLRHIYLPTVAQRLKGSVAATFSLGVKVIIAGEVLGQPRIGIGNSLQIAKVSLDAAGVMAWVMVLALLVAGVEGLLRFWTKKNYKWQD